MMIHDHLGHFTFQSGYIQMDYHIHGRRLCYFFTFQSGYIQIQFYFYKFGRYNSLHSNLVIFKSGFLRNVPKNFHLYIPIWLYSNAIVCILLYVI